MVKKNNGYITDINSSAFVDGDGRTEIDKGSDYHYHHAQHNYLDKPVTDEYGRYNYRYINDTVEEIPEEEKPPVPVPVPVPTNEELAAAVTELADIIMGGMM